MNRALANRAFVSSAPRFVVKIGSSSLTKADGTLNRKALETLSDTLSDAYDRNQRFALISSGAVAAGVGRLGIASRPTDMSGLQAAAMVGQPHLMTAYGEQFGMRGIGIGQVLLTADDVIRRTHYRNARLALEKLFAMGIIPIVNENDAVATTELRLGDNDRLAAIIAHLVRADVLILLTDVDGLYSGPPSDPGSRPIRFVGNMAELENYSITGRGSLFGTGGMATKVTAARMATAFGIPALVTSAENLRPALAGEPVGTWFAATGQKSNARALWIAHAAKSHGQVRLDAGAVDALESGGNSLLAVGITDVVGTFDPGDPIDILGPGGDLIARGLAGWDSERLRESAGQPGAGRPAVHVDDMVLLRH
ncbi:glutamate 5-kinase [Flaviflexus huanghaiensis]|uniref:glutamate 5-kinase n=1 Tax=Flaviflexus huanghaiensis TaxID=1111473 RepID=UPI0015FB914A|nr:glutamate 5-kinase [Flaviflexus huanghaiensis]